MKILAVISSLRLATGGPGVALREMAAGLSTRGACSTIACCEMDPDDSLSSAWPSGVVARSLGTVGLRGLAEHPPAELLALAGQADLIHLHGVWDPVLVAAARAARLEGKPFICTPHGMLSAWSMGRHRWRKLPYYHLFTKPMLRGAAAIHLITEMEAKLAADHLPRGTPRLIVPIIPSAEFYREPPSMDEALKYFPQVPADGPWVLFLSRIHQGKGLPEVIAAFPEVLDEFPSARLVIAGSGEPAYVQEMHGLAARAGFAESMHFVGLVRGEAKRALYRRASILAVPSSHENFGMVFVESLACGTPVLITPTTGIFEGVMRAGGGIEVKPEGASVAASLCSALRDPARLCAAGASGRKWVLEYLQPARVAEAMIENYKKILSRAAPPAGPR